MPELSTLVWSPTVHYIVTVIHIFAAVFWLGWMVFMFGLLRPVLTRMAPERASDIQSSVQTRIRGVVFWLIPVIAATGLYNMAYRGLTDLSTLLSTGLGHRMLTKLGAASIIFGIYYLAPILIRRAHRSSGNNPSEECHGSPAPLVKRVSVALHLLAFTSGLTAAFLGVTIGG